MHHMQGILGGSSRFCTNAAHESTPVREDIAKGEVKTERRTFWGGIYSHFR